MAGTAVGTILVFVGKLPLIVVTSINVSVPATSHCVTRTGYLPPHVLDKPCTAPFAS